MSGANLRLPQHQALLDGSAISPEVAKARGYRSATSKADLRRLGFSDTQCRTPALVVPIWGVAGEIVSYQIRPDGPRVLDGKALKYETPKGSRMALDVPPAALQWLGDPARPLFITEGARKADAGVSEGLCTIALLGVWNWRGTNEHGGKTALPDWESVALKGRNAFIVFDSDVMTKESVSNALGRLKGFLEQRGATVRVVYLPSGDGGAKVGLDDFLASGKNRDDLLALATSELRQPLREGQEKRGPYEETPNGLVWNRPVGDGTVQVPLTNFKARIVSEVIEDDGAETRRSLEIRAELEGGVRSIRVPATSFQGMNWALAELGPRAIVSPGFGQRDHARAAIQSLSRTIKRTTVYRHTGWRQIDGQHVYLHAGGAIGPEGPVPGIGVQLPAPLERYELPAPSEDRGLEQDAQAVFLLLEVAPARVAFPLFAMVWRAVLMSADFGIHVVGATGVLKSELAALMQRFLGRGMDARSLPGAWSSTENALEALAFHAKDALLTIDDFAPSGSKYDIQSYHRKADRVFRAQGNHSGRARMNADGSLATGRAPRGLVLSTGEDIPTGQSIRARVLIIEVAKGEVDLQVLTKCQIAAEGAFARVMSAFLSWVAGQFDAVQQQLQSRALELRSKALSSRVHARTPSIVADLQAGFEVWLAFAAENELLTEEEAGATRVRCWEALGVCVQAQSQHLAAVEPTTLFLRLIQAAISSGRAHVADMKGAVPGGEVAVALGWRASDIGDPPRDWRAQGERVGWIDGDDLYLDPDAAHKAAQEMGSETERLSIGVKTLTKRLAERQLLKTQDSARCKHTVRRQVQGARRSVLHMAASLLGIGALQAQEAREPAWPGADEASGPETWARNGKGTATSGPTNGPTEPQEEVMGRNSGPIGPELEGDGSHEREEPAAIGDHDGGLSPAEAERQKELAYSESAYPYASTDPEASDSAGGP